jgi:hypothetical protein
MIRHRGSLGTRSSATHSESKDQRKKRENLEQDRITAAF